MAFGSVAPTPMRARKAEQMLIGQEFSEDLVERASPRPPSDEVTPIDDVRSTAWYRREVVRVMAYDGLQRGLATRPAPALPSGTLGVGVRRSRASRRKPSLPSYSRWRRTKSAGSS